MKTLFKIILASFFLMPAHAQNWNQFQKLVASDRATFDFFGYSVSISSDYAIVGAYFKQSLSGSAYVFEKDGGGNWNQVQKLLSSDFNPFGDRFGYSVSINGDYAIVGAYADRDDAAGGGFPHSDAGSAFIFERDSIGNWSQVQKIVASNRDDLGKFGSSVSISGNYIVVGAFGDNTDALDANFIGAAGAAYIFERDSIGNWNQAQKIVASDRATLDLFGHAVSISGDFGIIGARLEDEDSAGGNTLNFAGSAYLFERDSVGNWNEVQKIVASDRGVGDQFGSSVSITGNYAAVGVALEDEDSAGGNTLNDAGSAYLFERDSAGNWNQAQKIVASDRDSLDYFGHSVSINENRVIVGAYFEDEDLNGIDSLDRAGSAYLFERDSLGNWNQIQKIVASVRETTDFFGSSVSISGDIAMVGAYFEDEDASGGDSVANAGAAYFFGFSCNTPGMIWADTCDTYISPSGNYSWSVSGTYRDTIPNAALCDSVITMFLTVNRTSETINPVVCDSFVSPSGNYTWTSSGIYMDTIPNSALCDSVITVNLSINSNSSETINTTACDSYVSPSGKYTWTTTGTYFDTIPNAVACDSVITINLTIITVDTSVSQVGNTLTANAIGVTYQWLDCNDNHVPLVGETSQKYTATSNGSYAVEITEDSCVDTSSCYLTTGIIENDFGSVLAVYPNPTTGEFIVDLGQIYQDVNVTVSNHLGQTISTKYIGTTQEMSIDIHETAGFYLIEIHTRKGSSAILKVLKE